MSARRLDYRGARSRFPGRRRACRGAVLIYVLIGMTAFVLLVSLGVDMGRVWVARGQLQLAADSAARAACAQLTNGVQAAQNAAVAAAAQNAADGTAVSINGNTDVDFGTWDPTTKTFTILNGSARSSANAVRVTASRTASNAVPLTFAAIAGKSRFNLSVQSTACLTGTPGAYSIIGLNGITMGLNAFTDSYNAATQGDYSASSAHHQGGIASNGNITLSGNAVVDGDSRCGVGMSTILQNSARVTGLNAPLGSNMSYPSVTLPSSYTDLGDVNMNSGTVSIPGGTYLIHNLVLSGTSKIIWTGPTVLYIRDGYNVSGSTVIQTYQDLPKNRVLYFLPTCSAATWSGTNNCVGELYAPDTDFTISGSVELSGRILARSINNTSSGGMHFDESLGPPGGTIQHPAISIVQ